MAPPWTQECLSSAHAQTPTFTAVYQLSGWIKAWFILFDYLECSVIRHGSGVRIIEVLLYKVIFCILYDNAVIRFKATLKNNYVLKVELRIYMVLYGRNVQVSHI